MFEHDREREVFICVHDHSVLACLQMASSPFVASCHLPVRQYQKRFGLYPQLWSVPPYRFHDSKAPFANPESRQHEPTRTGSCQTMHYHQTRPSAGRSGRACGWPAYCLRDPDNSRRDVETRCCEEIKWPSTEASTLVSMPTI
jgi:hypothetical protein